MNLARAKDALADRGLKVSVKYRPDREGDGWGCEAG
jgi:hypothetical protein